MISASTIQIAAGLDASDRVVQNPPDGVAEGAQVRIAGNAALSGNADAPHKG